MSVLRLCPNHVTAPGRIAKDLECSSPQGINQKTNSGVTTKVESRHPSRNGPIFPSINTALEPLAIAYASENGEINFSQVRKSGIDLL